MQGKPVYCRIKGSDNINVYNSTALNLKWFEESWAPPCFMCGMTRRVQYLCDLGQGLAISVCSDISNSVCAKIWATCEVLSPFKYVHFGVDAQSVGLVLSKLFSRDGQLNWWEYLIISAGAEFCPRVCYSSLQYCVAQRCRDRISHSTWLLLLP